MKLELPHFPITYYYLEERTNPFSRVRDAAGRRWWGYPRRKGDVDPYLVVLHTTEGAPAGPRTAVNTARWQASDAQTPSSYHVLIDWDHTVRTVRDESVAFHAVGFNTVALGLSWGTQAHTWGRNPKMDRVMIERGAVVAAEWCVKYGIPPRELTRAEAARGVKGFIRHSVAEHRKGRRSDPGSQFPMKEFLGLVAQYVAILEGREVVIPDNDEEAEAMRELVEGIQEALRAAGFDPGPIDGEWGPRTQGAFTAALAGRKPKPKGHPDEGKRLESRVDGLRFYDSPRWDNPTGTFDAGEGFVIEGTTSAGDSTWYRVRNSRGAGPYYVTTHGKYVRVV